MESEKDPATEELLESFRRQWETEISAARLQQSLTSSSKPKNEDHESGSKETVDEEEAKSLYLRGVKHEKSGEVVEAIKFYKRAMQLVPDIEERIYTYPKNKEGSETTSEPKSHKDLKEEVRNNNSDDEDDDELPVDLLVKLERLLLQDGLVCTPHDEPKGTHISDLPREIIIYLLKWVVSSDLDLRSLEQVSLVSRGLYVCSRDSEIWKLACLSVWNSPASPTTLGFTNYRDMFIYRPRLHFHGCYISKTSYVRQGENSFQDTNYQPWHLVNYFRYLRFYPDRTAIMSTTADIPSLVVSKRLKRKDPSCFRGFYTLHGNVVTCIFKRKRIPERTERIDNRNRRRNDEANNNGSTMIEQIFELELEIKTINKKKLHCALHWNRYSIQTVYQNKESTTANFDITATRFPPLIFSRVRSYNAQSEKPL
ncbi:F-box only protein 9-like isoform X2 [Daphnia pulicaria]|uniref:F-box only protein 9-like isoform X1 n=1 Tax=Daphnia pulicaria TaxID=35523 RepID=UPI001EEA13FA|nr:F-box only protein 9-like isoform X1 [Daphnia pulicaria]XP_046656495.1 F-box only protein 9-like isoform X2 [Daphnia pulicaria]